MGLGKSSVYDVGRSLGLFCGFGFILRGVFEGAARRTADPSR